jgi:hypothetical protein
MKSITAPESAFKVWKTRTVNKMFFPSRFQQTPKDRASGDGNVEDRPVMEKMEMEEEKEQGVGQSGMLRASAPIPIQGRGWRERRLSAPPPVTTSLDMARPPVVGATRPPPTTPQLLSMMTPPEAMRRSFVQVFQPTLRELTKTETTHKPAANIADAAQRPANIDDTSTKETQTQRMENQPPPPRTPTPVSMMMLRQEF